MQYGESCMDTGGEVVEVGAELVYVELPRASLAAVDAYLEEVSQVVVYVADVVLGIVWVVALHVFGRCYGWECVVDAAFQSCVVVVVV